MDGSDLLSLVSTISCVSAIFLHATGWPVLLRVIKRKSANEVSTFPHVTMLAGCSLWLRYGLLINNSTLIYTNVAGVAQQFIFTLGYYFYVSRKGEMHRQLFLASLITFPTLYYVASHMNTAAELAATTSGLGLLCTFMSIAGYGSPLAALGQVISSKSTASMNFLLCVANLIVGLEWTFYGYLLDDFNVLRPNALGALLSIAQLVPFFIYPSESK